jgi:hypothetical protein
MTYTNFSGVLKGWPIFHFDTLPIRRIHVQLPFFHFFVLLTERAPRRIGLGSVIAMIPLDINDILLSNNSLQTSGEHFLLDMHIQGTTRH